MKPPKEIDPQFVCKPLDSYNEILLFLENPPPWRTLCKEMTPHSDYLIRNIEINNKDSWSLERPENFCHFDPDLENVKRYESKSLPKTLVCHDMANGYHDDCVIEGTSKFDAYTFYNWAGIDIFCYFSHHLVTIPPVGWINVGHAHGVKVIGTIITEWAEGSTFWEQVLSSETKYQDMASALVAIAKTLKFDGYLLNIENKISHPELLLQFVAYLRRLLHEELPHATLLWYDSVTVSGTLNWQNKLNDKNMAFFEACDGLFTNYSWTKEDVAESAARAGARLTDLYVGIDVWGRNFYGGGQFNTQEAVKVVHEAGCSLAVFAPAWTHEALGSEPSAGSDPGHVAMGEDMDDYDKFVLRDRALWGSLWPFLNTRLPSQLPFQTSFCRGLGKKRFLYGEVLSPSPWYNVRHQQYQPNSAHGPHGYILTHLENLATMHREVTYKDKKGIIRIRSSFQLSRQGLHSVRDSPPAPCGVDSTSTEDSDEPEVAKPNAMSSLKNLFRSKALRIAFEDNQSADGAGSAESPADGAECAGELQRPGAGELQRPGAGELQRPGAGELQRPGAGELQRPGAGELQRPEQPSISLKLGVGDKLRYGLACVRGERPCLEPYLRDAFSGGACLRVNPSDDVCAEHRFTRLLHCDWPCDGALIFCVVTKRLEEFPEQSLNVQLAMTNAAGQELAVVLTGRDVAGAAALGAAAAGTRRVYPLRTAAEPVLRQLRTYLLLAQPDFYVPIDNLFGWTVRYYEVEVPGARVTSVNLHTAEEQGAILLGHFGVCSKLSGDGGYGSGGAAR